MKITGRVAGMALALTMTAALAACGQSEEERAAAASASASSAAAAARSSAADARRVAENSAAASSSAAEAAASASASAAAASSSSAAAEAARRVPTVFTGSGDDVVTITKPPGATVVTATITGNDAGRYFGVQGLDGDMDQLVNTTDPYNGTTLMDANIGGTTQLQVQASGPWSITLADLQFAPTFSGHGEGAGDAVVISDISGRTAAVTGNAEGRYFGVMAYGSNGSGDQVVNTTDANYSGRVPWPAGRVIVVVTAAGNWTIDVG